MSMDSALRERALSEISSRGMSVSSFTRKMRSNASTAQKWLYGIVSNPNLKTVSAVFDALGIEVPV